MDSLRHQEKENYRKTTELTEDQTWLSDWQWQYFPDSKHGHQLKQSPPEIKRKLQNNKLMGNIFDRSIERLFHSTDKLKTCSVFRTKAIKEIRNKQTNLAISSNRRDWRWSTSSLSAGAGQAAKIPSKKEWKIIDRSHQAGREIIYSQLGFKNKGHAHSYFIS